MDLPLDLAGADGAGLGLATMAGVLVVLALIDSTSFGTLLIPVWLLLAPGRLRAGRVLAYLATVAGCYLVVGIVVTLGAGAFLDRFEDALETRAAAIAQLLLGIGLFALSFRFDGKRAARRAERAAAVGRAPTPGRLSRWRERALGIDPRADGGVAPGGAHGGPAVRARPAVLPLVGLALGAVAIEVGTMLPYLAAIGIVTTSDVAWPASAGVLAAYCAVMVAPALLLLAGRLVAARAVDPLLHRLDRWLTKNAAETTGWVVGILGVLLALDAIGRLGWTG
ncbi:GAP family protein [Cellulosimicrobium arenosum]|uniref:GAP family protein n=1 Tax=Cellulosimicrobium arenosum TaxID=2708133 RepID=A0A927PG76_9MICO|nr:GAP family protein [Cellulosimicrobium arenosum]MBD8080312.1 GAP family protein [Cellulosimicrobium arenosum]